MSKGLEQLSLSLSTTFSRRLSQQPVGIGIDEFTGAKGTVYWSLGEHGTRVSFDSGRPIISSHPLVDFWIHNTLAQSGKVLVLSLSGPDTLASIKAGKSTFQITASEGEILDIATEAKQDTINASIEALQAKLEELERSGNGFAHGVITVNTLTPVQMPNIALMAGKGIALQARDNNTGNIFVVNSAAGTISDGRKLLPNALITLDLTNANLIYLVADVDGQVLDYIAETYS